MFQFFQKRKNPVNLNINNLDKNNLPKHIAIIMDGNGRWAKKKGLIRSQGHKKGSEVLRTIIKTSADLKIRMLTVYAFSTENWKRPKNEINFLMNLLSYYLENELNELIKNNIQMRFIGNLEVLKETIKKKLETNTKLLSKNTGLIVNVALNYGGRSEIIKITKELVKKVVYGKLNLDDIDEQIFNENLFTFPLSDVDLLIRTGSNYRISNFLLWQIAYTELYFSDCFWPDFSVEKFIEAIINYQTRDRRFGGL